MNIWTVYYAEQHWFAKLLGNITTWYRAAKCNNEQAANKQLLSYIKLNQEYGNSTGTAFICCACTQFNVLSGGFTECLDEPRHVGVCAAGSLQTTTLLSIPQWIWIVENTTVVTISRISTLTVVVTTNIRRGFTPCIEKCWWWWLSRICCPPYWNKVGSTATNTFL